MAARCWSIDSGVRFHVEVRWPGRRGRRGGGRQPQGAPLNRPPAAPGAAAVIAHRRPDPRVPAGPAAHSCPMMGSSVRRRSSRLDNRHVVPSGLVHLVPPWRGVSSPPPSSGPVVVEAAPQGLVQRLVGPPWIQRKLWWALVQPGGQSRPGKVQPRSPGGDGSALGAVGEPGGVAEVDGSGGGAVRTRRCRRHSASAARSLRLRGCRLRSGRRSRRGWRWGVWRRDDGGDGGDIDVVPSSPAAVACRRSSRRASWRRCAAVL